MSIESRRESRKKYAQSKKGKESRRKAKIKYMQSAKGKKTTKEYNKKYKEMDKGRDTIREGDRRRYLMSPKKYKARIAISHATRDGKVVRPNNCESCFAECKPEAHHSDYSKPLDVDWLCKKCHTELHKEVLV